MKTLPPPHPAINLSPQLYYQLVYTLTNLLPPPLDNSPEAVHARDQAAIAKVAAMLPANANEADLAAQSIAARAQADDIMRLIRENAHDIKLVARLNAQYMSMGRMSLATHKHLMRVQALRQKREAIEATAAQDALTRQTVERSMLRVADPEFERLTASPPAAREEAPKTAAPQAAPSPAPRMDRPTEKNVSQNNTESHDMAFETPMSDPSPNQGIEQTEVDALIHETMAQLDLVWRGSSANGRESPGRTA